VEPQQGYSSVRVAPLPAPHHRRKTSKMKKITMQDLNPRPHTNLHFITSKSQTQNRYSGVTVVLQWCYSGVTVVLQWCHSGVTVVLQWCYSDVTVVLQWCTGKGTASSFANT
jgi:hypothetical protein